MFLSAKCLENRINSALHATKLHSSPSPWDVKNPVLGTLSTNYIKGSDMGATIFSFPGANIRVPP